MNLIRRIIIGILGLLLILDALIIDKFELIPFIVGLLMVGLVPIDYFIDLAMRPAEDEGQIDRLREVMQKKDDDPPIEG